MPATNPYGPNVDVIGPASNALTVTPSDTTDVPHVSRGIYVDVAGSVAVIMRGGQTETFANMVAGVEHTLAVSRILATGTTATGIKILW